MQTALAAAADPGLPPNPRCESHNCPRGQGRPANPASAAEGPRPWWGRGHRAPTAGSSPLPRRLPALPGVWPLLGCPGSPRAALGQRGSRTTVPRCPQVVPRAPERRKVAAPTPREWPGATAEATSRPSPLPAYAPPSLKEGEGPRNVLPAPPPDVLCLETQLVSGYSYKIRNVSA